MAWSRSYSNKADGDRLMVCNGGSVSLEVLPGSRRVILLLCRSVAGAVLSGKENPQATGSAQAFPRNNDAELLRH